MLKYAEDDLLDKGCHVFDQRLKPNIDVAHLNKKSCVNAMIIASDLETDVVLCVRQLR